MARSWQHTYFRVTDGIYIHDSLPGCLISPWDNRESGKALCWSGSSTRQTLRGDARQQMHEVYIYDGLLVSSGHTLFFGWKRQHHQLCGCSFFSFFRLTQHSHQQRAAGIYSYLTQVYPFPVPSRKVLCNCYYVCISISNKTKQNGILILRSKARCSFARCLLHATLCTALSYPSDAAVVASRDIPVMCRLSPTASSGLEQLRLSPAKTDQHLTAHGHPFRLGMGGRPVINSPADQSQLLCSMHDTEYPSSTLQDRSAVAQYVTADRYPTPTPTPKLHSSSALSSSTG
ncbi:hypothetical protein GE09DRAFT_92122 [Coniochaeta sp. 2T2.1]|nr:hypothetical protein GE09DRAFT_92122 [Coniochaeta sp. 2T2.1]